MQKLSFQDSAFLKLESDRRPFHVAGLMILKMPDDAATGYLRRLAHHCGRLNEIWPAFDRQLRDPETLKNTAWVDAEDYDPSRHVFHYALPQPGRMSDLLSLVSAAHERCLNRSRPLWEIHLIEGLPGNRFALYCKVHHAVVDGVGALRMVDALFTTDPDARIDYRRVKPLAAAHHETHGMFDGVGRVGKSLLKQYGALPQLGNLFAHMGADAWRGVSEAMTLPFTAPHSLFNEEVDARRRVVIADLSLGQVRKLARDFDCTVNDILLSVCGGALRRYLIEQNALPRKSMVAGVPVSLKRGSSADGNQLSFILCPFFTGEPDPVKRVERVRKTTRKAKRELAAMSPTASQDFANMLLMPTIILTLSGNATRVNPVLNAIFSNVPGSRDTLYLEGAELQAIYPLSVVTDGMGLNLTVVSYRNKLCFAVTSCPRLQPGIDQLGRYLKESLKALREAAAE